MGGNQKIRQLTDRRMMKRDTTIRKYRPAGRVLSLLAGFVLLFGTAFAEEVPAEKLLTELPEEDVDLNDLLDLSELEEDMEEVEILPPDATLLAHDRQWHTPAEGSLVKCDHECVIGRHPWAIRMRRRSGRC